MLVINTNITLSLLKYFILVKVMEILFRFTQSSNRHIMFI